MLTRGEKGCLQIKTKKAACIVPLTHVPFSHNKSKKGDEEQHHQWYRLVLADLAEEAEEEGMMKGRRLKL